MLKKLITISFTGLLLTACSGNEAVKESASLSGTQWRLTSLNRSKPIGNRPINISFKGFRVSGNAGCNQYAGIVKHSGSTFHVDLPKKEEKEGENGTRLVKTKMYCPQPRGLMDQENTYLAQLQNSTRVYVEENQLIIKAGSDALVYQRVKDLETKQ